MKYEIFVLSVEESNVPYEVEGVSHKDGDIHWKFIGSIDNLEVAREMIIGDKVYMNVDGKDYWLEQHPTSDKRYTYCMLKYDNTIEYYDWYCAVDYDMMGRRK